MTSNKLVAAFVILGFIVWGWLFNGGLEAQSVIKSGYKPRTLLIYVDEPLHCDRRYQIGVQVARAGDVLFSGVGTKGKTFWVCGEK